VPLIWRYDYRQFAGTTEGATPTALRGRVFERQTDSHAHVKPWAWHPTTAKSVNGVEQDRRELLNNEPRTALRVAVYSVKGRWGR
jgi:hypothetical protein